MSVFVGTDEQLKNALGELEARGGTAGAIAGAAAGLIQSQAARIERLAEALRGMMGRYLELANSGDAGSWDPELEDEVIASRAALAKLEKEEGK